MKGLRSRTDNERPGRACSLAALSGRRAAQVGPRRRPGGPERASVKGSRGVLSAGRVDAPGQLQGERLGRGHSAARVIAALVACLFGASASAQTFVRAGQTGVTLSVEIENAADSGADINSAQVSAVASQGAPVTNIQVSPVAAVPIGQTKTFTVTFDITSAANDGDQFTMTLKDVIDDAVDPDPSTNDTVVSFTRSSPSAVVERVV